MSVAGDFFLSSTQRSSDSFMEVVKETILKQDLMFRMQAQNFLVKDIVYRDLDKRNSLHTIPQLPMFPPKDVMEYASPPGGSRLIYTNQVALTSLSGQDLPENHKNKHNWFQKRPLDIQLSANEFINNAVEETQKNWIMLDKSKIPTDTVHCLSNANFLDKEEMDLSLGLRQEKKRKQGKMEKWIHKAPQPCYQNVIDLDDSDEQESGSCRKYTPLCSCASPSVRPKRDQSMVSFFGPAMYEKKDPFVKISKCWSAEEKNECGQVQASLSKGNREHCDVLLHYHLSTKEKQPVSGQGWKLDLNEPFVDDSSQDSAIPILGYSPIVGSVSSSTLTPSTEENLRCLHKGSDIIQHTGKMDHASSDLNVISKSTDLFPIDNSKQSTDPAAGTSDPETMSISEVLRSCCTEQKNANIGASGVKIVSSLDGSNCKLTCAGVKSSKKSATETYTCSCSIHNGIRVQERHGDKSPVSCKSCFASDNDSGSAKSIQCGFRFAAPKGHPKTSLGSQCVDLLPDQHDTGTANPEDATMKSIDLSEESTDVMQRAAELLIQLSFLKNPTFNQGSRSKMENSNGKQPQHPADSFELMVLQLPEDNMDDECLSSQPFVSNDAEAKDFGRKLRRGRRMKDFQREILPTLASLSVHEIREDMNILEGVLTSRECRKTRAKMAAAQDQNWSAVKTSRRSRTNKVRRRIFT